MLTHYAQADESSGSREYPLEEIIFTYDTLPFSGLYHAGYPVGDPIISRQYNTSRPDLVKNDYIESDEAAALKLALVKQQGSIRKAAKLLNCCSTTLSNWLAGRYSCPPDALMRIRELAA